MRLIRLTFILSVFFLFACNAEQGGKSSETQTNIVGSIPTEEKKSPPASNKTPDYSGMTKIADTVSYTAIIKNPKPEEDAYMNEWLKGMNIKAFTDAVYNALLEGKIKGYNYLSGEEMSIEEIKAFDKEYSRDRIGNVLFTEDWYFDEKKMQMHKVVNSVMFGYENRDNEGNVTGHKSGIRVYFNDFDPMDGAL